MDSSLDANPDRLLGADLVEVAGLLASGRVGAETDAARSRANPSHGRELSGFPDASGGRGAEARACDARLRRKSPGRCTACHHDQGSDRSCGYAKHHGLAGVRRSRVRSRRRGGASPEGGRRGHRRQGEADRGRLLESPSEGPAALEPMGCRSLDRGVIERIGRRPCRAAVLGTVRIRAGPFASPARPMDLPV